MKKSSKFPYTTKANLFYKLLYFIALTTFLLALVNIFTFLFKHYDFNIGSFLSSTGGRKS